MRPQCCAWIHVYMAVLSACLTLPAMAQLAPQIAASGLNRPVFLTAPSGDSRLFVIEQHDANIRIVANGSVLLTPFLSLTGQVATGNEQGLLGMAFHPNYGSNGFFYVNYTDTSGDTHIVRYAVSANPNVADPSSALEIMTLSQPFSNHNAGMLAFGADGYLYVGTGDGGDANDPGNRAQTTTDPLGKMLRIDVDGGSPYAIPADNPFVGLGTHDERIWAIGLRNPWRYSFDRLTGDLYIGDVGQAVLEEIDFQPASSSGGENYGWKIMEGFECRGGGTACLPQPGLTLPVWDIAHPTARSITGGYVYRGSEIPQIQGMYFFADYLGGFVKSFRIQGGAAVDEMDWSADLAGVTNVVSFGEDGFGELYICSLGGTVYKVTALDSDFDGLSDFTENEIGTLPYDSDSDNDLLSDGWEVAHGTDPLDPTDPPAIPDGGIIGFFAAAALIATMGSFFLFRSSR